MVIKHCVGILIICLLVGCSSNSVIGKAMYWSTDSTQSPKRKFPEQREGFVNLENSFGVAFQGGGTRAAPAAVGQILGLTEIGIWQEVDYVSAISGGAWGAAPFIFLPDKFYQERAGSAAYERNYSYNSVKQRYFRMPRPEEFRCQDCAFTSGLQNQDNQESNRLVKKEEQKIDNYCTKFQEGDTKNLTCEEHLYLGQYVEPVNISSDYYLNYRKENNRLKLEEVSFPYSFSHSVGNNSDVFGKFISAAASFKGDETYADVIGQVFLKDFGLDAKSHFLGFEKYQCGNNLTSRPYARADKEKPFFIASGSLMLEGGYDEYVRYEYTPMYVGPLDGDHRIHSTAKKYVQPCAFDAFEYHSGLSQCDAVNGPGSDKNPCLNFSHSGGWGRTASEFTLSDVLASTGAAPAHTLKVIGDTGTVIGGVATAASIMDLAMKPITYFTNPLSALAWSSAGTYLGYSVGENFGFPEFRYLTRVKGSDWRLASEKFGDGGHIENSGVLSLLARQVKNIVVFVNSPKDFQFSNLTGAVDSMDTNLIGLFQHPASISDESLEAKAKRRYPQNAVFLNQEFIQMVEEFKNDSVMGRPLNYCNKLDVQDNKNFGIKAYQANVCFVHLSNADIWLNSINLDTKVCGVEGGIEVNSLYLCRLIKREKEFSNFPHYWTFVDRLDEGNLTVIKKTPEQSEALKLYTAWVVKQLKNDFNEMFDL